ncbi:hypothetical protein BDW62DRAFT_172058 [Aspergillus aurantiobrunneus]
MSTNQWSGHTTFNEVSNSAISEWPQNLAGYICKTPPVGPESNPRLAQCCSGPFYNITSPTSPDDPAYPVSCAALCQVDPTFDAKNSSNPYEWSDFFMCLTDGGKPEESGDVTCDTVTVEGQPAPTSFASSPETSWMAEWTSHWTSVVDSDMVFPTHWMPLDDFAPTGASMGGGESTSSATSTASVTTGPSETGSPSAWDSTTGSDVSPSNTSLLPSASVDGEEAVAPTGTSNGRRLELGTFGRALLVVSIFGVGWVIV